MSDEHIAEAHITWQDCVKASDDLIETLKLKLQQDPEHGEFWQQKISSE